MRLTAKILKNVSSVNHWDYANQAYIFEGQINEMYFQIVDLDKTPLIDKSVAFPEFPLRYMPTGAAVSLSVTFPALRNDPTDAGAEEIVVAASQPFPQDPSIWKLTLSSSQTPKTGNIQITLTEDGAEKTFLSISAIAVEPLKHGGC